MFASTFNAMKNDLLGMRKALGIIGAVWLAATSVQGQVQWMRQGGIGGSGYAIAADAQLNTYVAGLVNDPALFDQDTTGSHFSDAFLAKYDPDGNVQWVRTGGSELIDRAADIVLDELGNAYITGFFNTNPINPTVAFGGTVLNGLGESDLFVAKYDANGNLVWIRYGGGELAEEGRGICLAANGDLVVSGFFQDVAVFDDDTLVSEGLSDVLLLGYDTDGNLLWSAHSGGTGDDVGHKLTALPNGHLALVGTFQGTATFGGTTLNALGIADLFLTRTNDIGEPLWAVHAGGSDPSTYDRARDIAYAPNGDLVLCGDITNAADFDGTIVPSNGSTDVFIARYTGDGDVVWVHHGGGPQFDFGYGLAVDDEGNSFLTGQADDGASTVFDSITLAPFGNEAVFLAKYDAAGAVQWVRRYAPGFGMDVAVLNNTCLYFTGSASGIVGQSAFDDVPWQYVDRSIFTALFCESSNVGIAEPEPASFVIHPVPAHDQLYVDAVRVNIKASIIDATGRVIREVQLDPGTAQVSLSGLVAGAYALRLRTGEALRFVKE
jgi:hypothetical protein